MSTKKYGRRVFLSILVCIVFFNVPNAFGASKTLRIMIINWRMETEALQGFKDGLDELGYEVEYEEFIAQQEMERLSSFLRFDFTPQNYDYIYTFSTSAAKRTHDALEGKVPQIFVAVSFPVESGLVESLEKPEQNCTGATHFVPLELQIQVALELFNFETLLMLFNPREENSTLTREEMMRLSEAYNFEFTSLRVVSEATIQEALNKLHSGAITVDLVYLPSDSMITTHLDLIVKALIDMKQLHFAALKRDVERGALLGLANDYYKMGKAVAFLVDQHQRGTPLEEIPVKLFDDPTIFINRAAAETLEFEATDDLADRVQFIGQ